MGRFYCSIHLRCESRDAALNALERLGKKGHNFLVSPVLNGWVGVYPDEGSQINMARMLAKRLGGDLIEIAMADDDVFSYSCYREGKLWDEFCSCPDYMEPVSDRVKRRYRGRPERLAELIAHADTVDELRHILDSMRTEMLCQSDAEERFMKLTGIPNSSATYERLLAGETEGVEGWDDFVHVAAQTDSGERASRWSASRAQNDGFVRSLVRELLQQGRKQTALGVAAMWGHAPLVRELLASGCDANGSEEPNSGQEPSGLTALMRAGSPEVVRILLKAGADANACDSRGRTPLLYFLGGLHSESVYLKVVQDLLAAGADPTIGSGMTALGWARHRNSRKLEDLLEAAIVEWRRKSESKGH